MNYQKQIISEVSKTFLAVNPIQLQTVVDRIQHSGKVFCNGLGRSSLAMRGFVMRLVQLGRPGCMVGEVTTPAFGKDDLLLICSASGTSPVLLYHAQQAIRQGGSVAIITGSPASPLGELAGDIILIPASNKDSDQSELTSIQPMGSLFEQTSQLVCDTLTLMLMERMHISADDMRKRHANIE